jgi:hypothetical protein
MLPLGQLCLAMPHQAGGICLVLPCQQPGLRNVLGEEGGLHTHPRSR